MPIDPRWKRLRDDGVAHARSAWQWSAPRLKRFAAMVYAAAGRGMKAGAQRWSDSSAVVVPSNAQLLGGRETQQDSLACSDFSDRAFTKHGGYLAVVADGMGGYLRGEEASRAAVASFLEAYRAKRVSQSVSDALHSALETAGRQVLAKGAELGVSGRFGTTIVAAVCYGRKLSWVAMGDSRLYVARRGALTQLTRDHVYGVAPGAAGGRDAAAVAHDQGSLTSYLGAEVPTEIDADPSPYALSIGDRVLLCSDGLYRALSENEILAVLDGPEDDYASALMERVRQKNVRDQDNATALVLTLRRRLELRRLAAVGKRATPRASAFTVRPAVLFWLLFTALVALIVALSR